MTAAISNVVVRISIKIFGKLSLKVTAQTIIYTKCETCNWNKRKQFLITRLFKMLLIPLPKVKLKWAGESHCQKMFN